MTYDLDYLVIIISKHFFSAFGSYLPPVKLMRIQNYCLNSLALMDCWFSTLNVNLDWMCLEMVHTRPKLSGTTSIQRSDSEGSITQRVFDFCLARPHEHLWRGVTWTRLCSESYGAASIQHSDSESTATQLASSCAWGESNGTLTQRSESGFPSIFGVALESNFWPGGPAKLITILSKQVMMVTGELDQRIISWSDLFRITQCRTV